MLESLTWFVQSPYQLRFDHGWAEGRSPTMPPVDDPLGLQLAEVQHRCASLFQVEQRQESAVTLDILDVVERCREICANFAEKVNAYTDCEKILASKVQFNMMAHQITEDSCCCSAKCETLPLSTGHVLNSRQGVFWGQVSLY